MPWQPPHLPGRSVKERIEYWSEILRMPEDELGADHLRRMASQRLEELGVPQAEQSDAA